MDRPHLSGLGWGEKYATASTKPNQKYHFRVGFKSCVFCKFLLKKQFSASFEHLFMYYVHEAHYSYVLQWLGFCSVDFHPVIFPDEGGCAAVDLMQFDELREVHVVQFREVFRTV